MGTREDFNFTLLEMTHASAINLELKVQHVYSLAASWKVLEIYGEATDDQNEGRIKNYQSGA